LRAAARSSHIALIPAAKVMGRRSEMAWRSSLLHDFDLLHRQTIACTQMVLDLGRVSRAQLPRRVRG